MPPARRALTAVDGLTAEVATTTPWAAHALAVIDVETTGLNPASDRIVEVGVARFAGGELVGLDHWIVNPGFPLSVEARAVVTVTDEEIARAPGFDAIVPELRRKLVGHLPVAYNAEFDRSFLQAELARGGAVGAASAALPPAFATDVRWIDPLVWSRALFQGDGRGHKLSDACARLGIAHETAPRRVSTDAEVAGRVLLALSTRLPATYGELIRMQAQCAARQEMAMGLRGNRARRRARPK